MSFTTKLLSSSAQIWQSIGNASRSFHILMRPIVCGNITEASTAAGAAVTSNSLNQVAPVNNVNRLLTPFSALLTQVAGFKVKGRLRRRCKDCYIVVRQERAYVICPTHPRHKQMAMKKRDYKSWILTHATQSKVRGY